MKTVSDNEIIDTSRGHKRIGAIFDDNAMLHATNKDLLLVQADLLAACEQALKVVDAHRRATGGCGDITAALMRSAIDKAKGGA